MSQAHAHDAERVQPSFVFELTQRCNHDCLHCYNAWKAPVDYPMGELGTAETLAMLGKMLDDTGASLVTLSGGEPMLRTDVFHVVDFLRARGVGVNLITNGSLLSDAAIARFGPDKIGVFELPLLSCEREIHDRMSGRAGAFDDATLAITELKSAGGRVVAVFVATKLNLHTWRETTEMALALGVDGVMFNRFNPGGCGFANLDRLQVSPRELSDALEIAESMCVEFDLPISCSIAMPPCLFETGRDPHLGFGFCAAGTERAYYTLDPLGNVRPCNHSATILGNIREGSFWDMADGPAMRIFMAARPEFCSGCGVESECQGGCKAAAEVCFGSANEMDPFLATYHTQAVKPG